MLSASDSQGVATLSEPAQESQLPAGLSLSSVVSEDYVNHGRDWTRPGFRAVAVHRFGVWRMGIRNRYLRGLCSFVYGVGYRRCRNVYGIELPYSVRLGRGVVVEHQGGIVVHGNSVIGDRCILRQGVTLGIRSLDKLDHAPVLVSDVSVGAGACILGRVRVGAGALIGANSVVLHDVDDGATVVGIPARPVNS